MWESRVLGDISKARWTSFCDVARGERGPFTYSRERTDHKLPTRSGRTGCVGRLTWGIVETPLCRDGPANLLQWWWLCSSRAEVAQLVEHVTENHGVGSSILPLGTNIYC